MVKFMSLNRLVLVINASYEAVNTIPARRAITLLFKGAAVVEKPSPYFIKTPSISFRLPSVIRLVQYRRVPRMSRAVSRKSIMLRDRMTCQYCSRQYAGEPKKLTLDHVIPRSRGGGSTWENLVACCLKCNNVKSDRTPEEAGMTLARHPGPVTSHAKHKLMQPVSSEDWEPYLFA